MNKQQTMQIILIAMILLCGYLYLWQLVTKHASNRNRSALTVMAVVLLMLYVFLTGALMLVLSRLGSMEMILMALLMLIASVALCLSVYGILRDFRSLNKGMLALFLVYMLAMSYITYFSRDVRRHSVIMMVPFAALKSALKSGSQEALNHLMLNVAMFVPLGMLLPAVCPQKLARLRFVLPIAMMCTTLIESLQLITRMGDCDIDDIIANTSGAVIGYFLYKLYRRFSHSRD